MLGASLERKLAQTGRKRNLFSPRSADDGTNSIGNWKASANLGLADEIITRINESDFEREKNEMSTDLRVSMGSTSGPSFPLETISAGTSAGTQGGFNQSWHDGDSKTSCRWRICNKDLLFSRLQIQRDAARSEKFLFQSESKGRKKWLDSAILLTVASNAAFAPALSLPSAGRLWLARTRTRIAANATRFQFGQRHRSLRCNTYSMQCSYNYNIINYYIT